MGFFTSKEEDLAEKIAEAERQGAADAGKGERNLPYTAIQQVFALDTPNSEIDAVNNAYDSAQANYRSQTNK